jgi:hypothetical protein
MKGVDNIKDNLSLVITMLVFIIFIGVIFIWGYNFMALSEDKLFDDNNKYIDATLSNPDFEDNYKSSYKNKLKIDGIQLNIMSWFSGFKGIFIIAFLTLLLFSLILKNRKTIMDNLKNMFN